MLSADLQMVRARFLNDRGLIMAMLEWILQEPCTGIYGTLLQDRDVLDGVRKSKKDQRNS